jgi:hypothetical protein
MADEDQQNDLTQLREAADEGRRARAEADRLNRENAMLRAGVDLDSKAGQYFVKGYEGELTREAILAEAEAMQGVIRGATPAATPAAPVVEHDISQGQDRMDLAAGSAVPSPDQANPYAVAEQAWEDARKSGGTRESAAAAPLAVLLEAAQRGDRRVIVEQ